MTKLQDNCKHTRLQRMAALVALATIQLAGCQSGRPPPLKLADHVDMNRVYGGWHIVATIPNSFEKGMVEPYDVFSSRPDGDIREDFFVRKGSFAAPRQHFVVHDWIRRGSGGANWRVQVFWPINLPFLMIYHDPQYQYLIFGEDDRKLGWIYARQPDVPEADYRALLEQLSAAGYDTQVFRKFVQRRDQIGRPGYWSEGVRP